MLKRALLFIGVLLLCLKPIYAAHNIGGELYYRCLGNNDYEVTLHLYRDCNHSTQFDFNAAITIFNANGSSVMTVRPRIKNSKPVVSNSSNTCKSFVQPLCVERGTYIDTVNLPATANGYTLAYQRCCASGGVVNVTSPTNVGLTVTTKIPGSGIANCNSTPVFNNFPPINLCVGLPFNFNFSATDGDGDSLAYELCNSYSGGTFSSPRPNTATAPPYSVVPYLGGNSGASPMPTLVINPTTGVITGTPNQAGKWIVKVCVKEYRNGVLIGSTARDFQFNITNCNSAVTSSISPQLSGGSNSCQGMTINFQNSSVNGTNYHWDFGDPSITNDTSNVLNPQWTYASPGTYTVTLIVDPGTPCADTATSVFNVAPLLDPSFVSPGPQCLSGNSFSFNASGSYVGAPTSTFSWDFGSGAQPGTSNIENPINIVYNTPGVYTVSLTVSENGCTATFTGNLTVHPMAEASFSSDTFKVCLGEEILFNASNTAAPGSSIQGYRWSFGDGTFSNASTVSHTYLAAAQYNGSLSLNATTINGCDSTYEFNFDALVYEQPTAAFTVDPKEVFLNEATIRITNNSLNGNTIRYDLGDGNTLNVTNATPDVKHEYSQSGNYRIEQVVESSGGCLDSAYTDVTVLPGIVFMPNAITVNGDNINDKFLPVLDNSNLKIYSLEIYDRWGNKLFQTSNAAIGWDGRGLSGEVCPVGVYVYRLTYAYQEELGETIVGHLTLLK